MITINDVRRMLAPIRRKLFLVIGRALLQAIDDSEGTQKVQLTLLDGETITGVERFSEYGFESYPAIEAQGVTVFLNGNRSQGIVIAIHDRRYRPKGELAEGEVMVYTKEHSSGSEHCIHLKQGRIIDIKGAIINLNE